jgi:nitroimidazol reductase NimA-like FMN-containing flavoprotein (pyridoxamine 5'-phosphate oxidase superfamily)
MTESIAESSAESIAESTAESAEELLHVVDTAGCLRLLTATHLGRLAVVVEGRPRIVVLNHLRDARGLVFRTGVDALLARLTGDGRAVHAAYEADSVTPTLRSGWSVIARGLLARENDPEVVAHARRTLETWAHGERDTVLRLTIEELHGRHVGPL